MAIKSLGFDIFARDGASDVFKRVATTATLSAEEMRAAFADEKLEIRFDETGFDKVMGEVEALKLAAQDTIVQHERLMLDINKTYRKEMDNNVSMLRRMIGEGEAEVGGGGGVNRRGGTSILGGLFHGLVTRGTGGSPIKDAMAAFGEMSGKAKILTLALGSVGGVGLAGAAGAAGIAIGGLASALTSAAGAAGVMGLAVYGQVKGFMALEAKVKAAQTALAGATKGTATYTQDARKLHALQAQLTEQYGPLVKALHDVKSAWNEFLGATKHSSMRLLAEGGKILADALRLLAPVANAAMHAMMPLLRQLDAWVNGAGFAKFAHFLETTGTQSLVSFIKLLGQMGSGFLHLMEYLAPVAKLMVSFLSHINTNELIAVGIAVGAIVTAFNPLWGVLILLPALGALFGKLYADVKPFREAVQKAWHTVQPAFEQMAAAAKKLWSYIGGPVTKIALYVLENVFHIIGDLLGSVMHQVTAFLDLLTGNWRGALHQLWLSTKDYIDAILGIFGLKLPQVERWVKGAASKIVGFFKAIPAEMTHIGNEIINGIIVGMENRLPFVGRATGTVADFVKSHLMMAFGIASPATMMIPIGENISAGIAAGIDKGKGAILSTLVQIGQLVHDFAASIFSTAPNGALATIGRFAKAAPEQMGIPVGSGALSAITRFAKAAPDHIAQALTNNSAKAKLKAAGSAAGSAVASGMSAAMTKAMAMVNKVLTAQTSQLSTDLSALSSLRQALASFESSMTSAFAASMFGMSLAAPTTTLRDITKSWTQGGVHITTSHQVPIKHHKSVLRQMFEFSEHQRTQARRLNRDVGELLHKGLSRSLIEQLASSGSSGMAEITALAHASRAQVERFNRLNHEAGRQREKAADQLGAALYDGRISAAEKRVRRDRARLEQTRTIERAIHKGLHGITLKIDGSHGRLTLREVG